MTEKKKDADDEAVRPDADGSSDATRAEDAAAESRRQPADAADAATQPPQDAVWEPVADAPDPDTSDPEAERRDDATPPAFGEHDEIRDDGWTGGRVAVLAWLVLLTLAIGYLGFVLVGAPANLRASLRLEEDPAVKASIAAGQAASAQSEVNAAALARQAEAAQSADAERAALAADAGELSGRIDDMAGRIEALGQELAATKNGLGAPAPNDQAAALESARAARAEIQVELDRVRAAVDRLRSERTEIDDRLAALEERAAKSSGRSLAAAMLALNDLREATSAGEPFAILLSRAKAILPEAEALESAPWVAFADRGLPTEEALLIDLQQISIEIGQAELKQTVESGESWLDRVVGGVIDRVKVRRVSADVEGGDPAAVASRAEAKLLEGDLAGAIAEVEGLDGDARARFEDWFAGAKAVAGAGSDIDAIEQAAIAAADGT